MGGVLSNLSGGKLKNVDSRGSPGPRLWVLSPVEEFSVARKLGLWGLTSGQPLQGPQGLDTNKKAGQHVDASSHPSKPQEGDREVKSAHE